MQYQPAASLAADLDAVRGLGAGWVRIDLNWADIQRHGPQDFDWARYDAVVDGARARGLRVLAILAYAPQWANGRTDNKYPPSDPGDFGAFCRAAAERYAAAGVAAWEVWNEPNIPAFWKPAPDPAGYVALLRECAGGLRAADPGAVIVTGGTSPAPDDGVRIAPATWAAALYAQGAAPHFDALGHHPYSWPETARGTSDWNAWHQMAGAVRSIRSVMAENGDAATPIWATEVGAPTNEMGEEWQAAALRDAWAAWSSYPWAGPLFWYSLRDLGEDPADREHWFGLLRRSGSAKPAALVYRELAPAS